MDKKSIFEYQDFEKFLKNSVEKNTLFRRGDKKALAEHLNLHPTSLSQVFSGVRTLTDEQAFLMGEYLGLSEIEEQYLILLNQIYNSANKTYKTRLKKRLNNLKTKSLDLSKRLEKDKVMSDGEKATFYSSWQYTSIWVYISLEGGKTREEIHERFGIDKKQIAEILEFLLIANLCTFKNNRYFHAINRTHLEKSSPYIKQHHSNWRIKAIQRQDNTQDDDLNFTAPLSLSKSDYDKLREDMVKLIKNISDTVQKTDPEDVYCVNLDFFRI